MIIKQQESSIFGSQVQMGDFSIKSSPKAFQILSSNLYSNKIRAVIREYSCNALDAHRYANKEDVPFKVHLPSSLDQQFIVRDFGNGLSPQEIQELFTTYFSSSKDQSNDFTGALGLGSKSAFSYTDSFSCKSYWNGDLYVYSLFLDGGQPKVSLMYQEKTNEPSGVEIIIPVKNYDITDFIDEAEFVYQAFDVKPDGSKKCLEGNVESVIIPGLKINKMNRNSVNPSLFARMGNVLYPIDSNYINDSKILNNLRYFGNKNSSNLFYVDFDIGELDIAPSREQLSYDKRTIENINKKLDSINLSNVVHKYLNSQKSNLDKSSWVSFGQSIEILFDKSFNYKWFDWHRDSEIKSFMETCDKINGKTFDDYQTIIDEYFIDKRYDISTYTNMTHDQKKSAGLFFEVYNKRQFSKNLNREGEWIYDIKNYIRYNIPWYKDDVIVILKDQDWKGIKTYLPEWFANNHASKKYFIFDADTKTNKEIKLYLENQFKGTNLKVHYLSDIYKEILDEKKENQVRVTRSKSILGTIWKQVNDINNVQDSSEEEIDLFSKEEFRRYLKKNPELKFISYSTYSKYCKIGLRKDTDMTPLNSVFLHNVLNPEFDLDNLKHNENIAFIKFDFRWNDLISEENRWVPFEEVIQVKNVSKVSFAHILLSLGFGGCKWDDTLNHFNYIADISPLIKANLTQEELDLRNIIVNILFDLSKVDYYSKNIKDVSELLKLLESGFGDMYFDSDSIKQVCYLYGVNPREMGKICKVKLIGMLTKIEQIKFIFDMSENSKEAIKILQDFSEAGKFKNWILQYQKSLV